jgi:FtsH-binding integral membrane protein
MSYGYDYSPAASAARSERAAFIRRTYAHVAGAVLALVGLEALLLNTVDHMTVLRLMFGAPYSWLVVLLCFMGAGWLARVWASSDTSRATQYLGLGLYVVAWAVIMLPLLIVANAYDAKTAAPGQWRIIPTAGIMTLTVFGGLTLAVFVTGKDFSFLGAILSVGTLIALGIIVVSILIGFSLGMLFCYAMVALISGYILYDTSNVMLHYRTDQHVAAALQLFGDVAILFWYIVQILLMSRSRD